MFNETNSRVGGVLSTDHQDYSTLPWVPNYVVMIGVVIAGVYGAVRVPCAIYTMVMAEGRTGGDEPFKSVTSGGRGGSGQSGRSAELQHWPNRPP